MLQRLVRRKHGGPFTIFFFLKQSHNPLSTCNAPNIRSMEFIIGVLAGMNASVMYFGTTSVFALYHNALSQVNKIRSSR